MVQPELVVVARPGREHHDEILRLLLDFNTSKVGPTLLESLAVVLRHPESGTIIGGLWGESDYDWLYITMLVVPEKFRKRSLGSALIKKAEELAVNRGCVGIRVDTFSFQAPEFYEKLGYQKFGKLVNHPKGHDRIYYFKALPEGPVRADSDGSSQMNVDPLAKKEGRSRGPRTIPTLRIARPSDDLNGLLPFYRDGLGLMVLYRFENHDGFDGLMLGREGAPYHFEFTKNRGHLAGRAPTEDNLFVFYYPDVAEWRTAVQRMLAAGFAPVGSANPFWDRRGLTFEDPDGYRIVLQNASWDR